LAHLEVQRWFPLVLAMEMTSFPCVLTKCLEARLSSLVRKFQDSNTRDGMVEVRTFQPMSRDEIEEEMNGNGPVACLREKVVEVWTRARRRATRSKSGRLDEEEEDSQRI